LQGENLAASLRVNPATCPSDVLVCPWCRRGFDAPHALMPTALIKVTRLHARALLACHLVIRKLSTTLPRTIPSSQRPNST